MLCVADGCCGVLSRAACLGPLCSKPITAPRINTKQTMLSAALLPGPHEIQLESRFCRGADRFALAAGGAALGAALGAGFTLLSLGVSDESLSVLTMLLRQAGASRRQWVRLDRPCRDNAVASYQRDARKTCEREAKTPVRRWRRIGDTIGAQGANYHLICVSNVPVSTISNFISPRYVPSIR
jgi:hypothetical protein